jgi:hypothetical protein
MNVIQICSWCLPQTVRVLNGGLIAPHSSLRFHFDKSGLLLFKVTKVVDGMETELVISHGICPEHKAQWGREPAAIQ